MTPLLQATAPNCATTQVAIGVVAWHETDSRHTDGVRLVNLVGFQQSIGASSQPLDAAERTRRGARSRVLILDKKKVGPQGCTCTSIPLTLHHHEVAQQWQRLQAE